MPSVQRTTQAQIKRSHPEAKRSRSMKKEGSKNTAIPSGKKLSTQLVLHRGRMISVPVNEADLCSFCKSPAIDAMSCACGTNVKCRGCIVSSLLMNKGTTFPSNRCLTCDSGLQESQPGRFKGDRVYDEVESIIGIGKGLNREGFEWCISIFSRDQARTAQIDRAFYTPLSEGHVHGIQIPFRSSLYKGDNPWMKTVTVDQGQLLRRPISNQRKTADNSVTLTFAEISHLFCKEGLAMLGSADKTFRIAGTKVFNRGVEDKLIVKDAGFNDAGFNIVFDKHSLPGEEKTDVSVICQIGPPGAVNTALAERNHDGFCSAFFIVNSTKETAPVTVNLQHCLYLPQEPGGIDKREDVVNVIKVDLAHSPFKAELLKAEVSHAHQYASLQMTLPANPMLLAVVKAPAGSDEDKGISSDSMSERAKQRQELESLIQLPLAGSKRDTEPYNLRSNKEHEQNMWR